MKRHGWPLNADGAQRAASRIPTRSALLITAPSSKERGLLLVAMISFTGTDVSALM
jgi:hypothetical protein